ncbi:TPA: type VI secretion protein VasK [Escherichia coli]|nr:type VI secretion protein VasK [Escherichia coli]HEL8043413.1 type VI secretion protein VasK [Escherichia coli]HEL8049049.1 type VI secretion protein VasK [Escherichia coli]HEL8053953.1 type VI secretion protein VasK [Escherichia coli]HEL8058535.1 type VI secretion protein VasK [Escherichia coli]
MEKKKRISTWLIVAIILFVGIALIWLSNPFVHPDGREKKMMASLVVIAVCLGILLFDELFVRLWCRLVALSFIQKFKALTGKEPERTEDELNNKRFSVIVKEIRRELRNLHGRRWFRRIRILLVTGYISDVEQLTPGLTTQYWQEEQGTLLLWGGDPIQPENSDWLTALRRLRYRPADGIVWVTSGLSETSSTPLTEDDLDRISRAVSLCCEHLGWRLPLYVWSLQQQSPDERGRITQPVGCLLPAGCSPDKLRAQLQAMLPGLVAQGIQQICCAPQYYFLLSLAERFRRNIDAVAEPLSALLRPYRQLLLAGIVFSPATVGGERSVRHRQEMDNRWQVLPETVQQLPARLQPSRTGHNWRRSLTVMAAILMMLQGTGMVVSFLANRSLVSEVQEQIRPVQDRHQPLTERLQALLNLQKSMARLQYREEHGAPWYLRAGMNQNADLLTAVTPFYAQNARLLLRDAAAAHLEQQLGEFIRLPPESPQRERMAKSAYDQLRLYLMLAQPQHMEPAWFSRTLIREWPQRDGVSAGFWQANGQTLLVHYATGLVAHPQWKLTADEELVSQTRTLLLRHLGTQNSDAMLYQKMLARVAHQFADMRLTDMSGDTDVSRLFFTDEVVPGMFTRQAWEEAVLPVIDTVINERREEMDWVLTDGRQKTPSPVSPEVLRQRLTTRYFADFGNAWLNFLNSLQLRQAQSLSDVTEQLTLMADVRESPLVALMNTLAIQGRTGQPREAVTDSLVKSARNLLSQEKQPVTVQENRLRGPLSTTFGPVLALMDNQNNSGDMLNLQTYLTRVTQVRLRLQQIAGSSDPQAMMQVLAQTVLQGKSVDLTDTRDYGSLTAAGLGQEWYGFGQTVFVRPMEQAWQQVLTPAAESLNTRWRTAVVDGWNNAFSGRYPFKNASSDASLPLLAKYLNMETGRIARFLQNNLSGVLRREGNRWVPDTINTRGLTFNPAFLKAINTLSEIADVAFTTGDAGLHFELRPGTAAGVMQTTLITDNQKLIYVNQMPVWKRFTWPADTEAPGASLSWVSTQAGTRQYADLPGSWGLIRLFEMARRKATPGVASGWSLSWQAQDGRMLNYTLRTEAGEGPLVLLKLRNFVLPQTVFELSGISAFTGNDEDAGDTAENTD